VEIAANTGRPARPSGHLWTNGTLTPLQRPAELGNKPFFTEDEAAAFEQQRIRQNDVDRIEGARGEADLARRAYNNVWFDRGTRTVKSRRTSLIVDPPDGKVPPFTPEAQAASNANTPGWLSIPPMVRKTAIFPRGACYSARPVRPCFPSRTTTTTKSCKVRDMSRFSRK
jgi:hypothetical protein